MEFRLCFSSVEIISIYVGKVMGRIKTDDHLSPFFNQNFQLDSKGNNFPFVRFMVMPFSSIIP